MHQNVLTAFQISFGKQYQKDLFMIVCSAFFMNHFNDFFLLILMSLSDCLILKTHFTTVV